MFTSRKRNFTATAGRLTAVTLSLALLSGCNGARFVMGGDPAPVNPAAAPAAPAPAQALRFVNVSGKASLSGVPLANATVKVFDALSDLPAMELMVENGKVTGVNGLDDEAQKASNRAPLMVLGQALTTDAQGNFTVTLGNFAPGMAARIVVTAGDKSVTTLVTGSGKSLQSKAAAYHVSQAASGAGGTGTTSTGSAGGAAAGAGAAGAAAAGGITAGALAVGVAAAAAIGVAVAIASNSNNPGNTTQANINEYTHIANQLLWGYSKLAGSLNPDSASNIIDSGIVTVNTTMMQEIEARVSNGDANQFAQTDATGRVKDTQSLNTFTKAAGLEDKATSLLSTGVNSVANASQNKANVVATVTLTKGDLAGSAITVTQGTNGQLTFTNEKTGEAFTVTLPPPSTSTNTNTNTDTNTNTNTNTNTTTDNQSSSNDTQQQDTSNAGVFKPTVTTSYSVGNFTVTVAQPGSTDDVAAIYARIPTSGNTLGDLTGNIGTGTVTITGQSALNLVLQKNAAASENVTLPPVPFAGATLSNAVWAGYLQTTPGNVKVATFQVFTAGSFHYLVTKYNLTDSVKVNRGHTTTVTTAALTAIKSGTEAEIMLVSRNGNFYSTRKTL